MKDRVLRFWANLIGWRTRQKFVVIESDDWGAIRTPSPKILEALEQGPNPITVSRFDRFDCLESRSDLELLFELLSSHKDSRGKTAKMTLNTVMGNPEFSAIRDSDFVDFRHEHFFDSYLHYHGQDLRDLWHSAIDSQTVQPQFHAREHLNSRLWLRDLRDDVPGVRRAFDLGFFALRGQTSSPNQSNYLAAYWCENQSDLEAVRQVLREGLRIFEDTFGFPSATFIPCNYIFPSDLEEELRDAGVSMIQGQRGQAVPVVEDGGRLAFRRRYTGQVSETGLRYSVRNVVFEPYADQSRDAVDTALRQISEAFMLRRPAILVTHRINYVSGLDIENRDSSLRKLDLLLSAIRKKWPDVRFLGSADLAELVPARQ
jgi:hypothetical protein